MLQLRMEEQHGTEASCIVPAGGCNRSQSKGESKTRGIILKSLPYLCTSLSVVQLSLEWNR